MKNKLRKTCCRKCFLWAALVVSFLTIFELSGCRSQKFGTAASSITNSHTSTATNAIQTFKIGDVVSLNGLNLSVTKIENNLVSHHTKIKDGNIYVIVYVKIQNKSKGVIRCNPYFFKVKNSKGQISGITFTTINKDTALNSGDLSANGEKEGSLAFEEPYGDNGLILLYQSDVLIKDGQISINLQ